MISTSQVIEELIRKSPFLEEVLASGIVNYSSLARKFKPQVEKRLLKNIKEGAIVMALMRLSQNLKKTLTVGDPLKALGDITIRSNLIDITFLNSPSLIKAQEKLLTKISTKHGEFLTISSGTSEVTIIASRNIEEEIKEIFKDEKEVSSFSNLSSITIRLNPETSHIPGVYYSILKLLAWERINVTEVVSTYTELTIVLENKDIDHAFSILKNFTENSS